MTTSHDYDELARRAERGELAPVPGTSLHGEEAATFGSTLLQAATETSSMEDAVNVALGRPTLEHGRPTNRVWKVRTTEDLDDRAAELAERQGINKSTLVRKAVQEYLTRAS
jgi:predicted HicB family RNase H-like nuclease